MGSPPSTSAALAPASLSIQKREVTLELDPKVKPRLGDEAPSVQGQAQVVHTEGGDLAMTTPTGRTIPLRNLFGIDNAVDITPGRRVQYRMRPLAHPLGARSIITGAGSPEVTVLESSSDKESATNAELDFPCWDSLLEWSTPFRTVVDRSIARFNPINEGGVLIQTDGVSLIARHD